ncbi:PhzF family phenazine biosynthesis protein [Desertivirga xinjiangensis]|uniref:PhzF family phenazine biosynthesis protein n=1 Tax=Desertivirga xinjiangensis TaxID=539206 RepID=UPI00210B1271|nr:PhzF family phenazine biosynthesis protein [Pedobacter xinjiangensis]
MQIAINILNAFTTGGRGGNPAAVVLDADDLSSEQKQQIAMLAGLSETAFISRSAIADFKFDFFTPVRQIADCGHATVAAFAYLKQTGRIPEQKTTSNKETIDGRREIIFKGQEVFMEQKAPVFSQLNADDAMSVAASLKIADTGYTPLISDNGNRFVLLEVASDKALSALKPDMLQITTISAKHKLIGYYIFCNVPGADSTTRMFAPAYGIPEESATGMAAGQLAAYLYQSKYQKQHFQIHQGHFMNPSSPSLIQVDLDIADGKVTSLFAGGSAQLVSKRIVEI